ncbi:hypothetical protein BKA57DRAFT_470606 [Linnemannia elongata]|nr:hypothetical protein BKA57DRAFT_470606 [Linnemannia elongata]
MSFYGATTWSDGVRGTYQGHPVIVSETNGIIHIRNADVERGNIYVYSSDELAGLLDSGPRVHGGNTCSIGSTRSGRYAQHYRQHRMRYSLLWWAILIIALVVILGPYYYEEHKKTPSICESDLSYPAAVILSMFFGVFGIDRFYLGYIFVGLIKLFTAGGFGILWVVDIFLIIFGGLPDHNGCALASPF